MSKEEIRTHIWLDSRKSFNSGSSKYPRQAGEWDSSRYLREPHTPFSQDILAFAWDMKKNAKPDVSIKTAVRRLNVLARRCDITDPEQVKVVLATTDAWYASYKENIAWTYAAFLKFIGKAWEMPKYKRQRRLPYIPIEQELDILISAARRKPSTLLQFLKETGARIGEAHNVKWSDVDTQRRLVYIRAEKDSNDRYLPLSEKLLTMISQLPRTSELVFPSRTNTTRKTFESIRNRTAIKLANPRLKQIHLHTFRHWKATTEYHKTRDIYHVKEILGHKSVKSTEIYIHLDKMLSNYSDDEYTTKVAKTADEIRSLVENCFTKADEIDGLHIYKKRK